MKKAYALVLGLISILTINNCSNKKFSNIQDTKLYNLIERSSDLNDLFRLKNKIELNIPDSILVSDDFEVKLNHEYILMNDKKNVILLLFDSSGKFIRKISQIGEGPGEIRSSTSIYLNLNGIYVLDEKSLRIKCFSLDGEIIFEVPISSKNNNRQICVKDNKYYIHHTPSKSNNYYLSVYDEQGFRKGIIEGDSGYAPYYYRGFLDGGLFLLSDGSIYLSNTYSENIYKIKDTVVNQVISNDSDWKKLVKNESNETNDLNKKYYNHTIPFAFLPFYNEKYLIQECVTVDGEKTQSISRIYSCYGDYIGSINSSKLSFNVSDGNYIGNCFPFSLFGSKERYLILLYEIKI